MAYRSIVTVWGLERQSSGAAGDIDQYRLSVNRWRAFYRDWAVRTEYEASK